jgi:hypothetical protein
MFISIDHFIFKLLLQTSVIIFISLLFVYFIVLFDLYFLFKVPYLSIIRKITYDLFFIS